MFNLKNKHIFITGGASGIGLAVAKRLSDAGAVLSICDLNDQETDLGQYFQADVSDPFALEQALSQAAKHTPIDVLINNAGINGEDGVSIEDSNLDLTRRLLDINTLGVYHGLKFGPRFMNDGGSIINTSSLGATLVFPGSGPYSASKASILSLTQMAAAELAPRNIRVNAVAPAFVKTQLTADDETLFEKISANSTLTGRMANPEEIASVYHFLASDDASYVNGQVINVDGGMSVGFTNKTLELITAS